MATNDDAAVLSDVEDGDDPVPISIDGGPTAPCNRADEITVERFRELQEDLDSERAARDAAEASKLEIQSKFNRLKALAHEAIKKRDDALREKEEALRANERLSGELGEVSKSKDEVSKQRDDIARQLEEAVKARDGLVSEMESSRHMLVSAIDKISGKVSNFKTFGAGGLPRSPKYTGLPSVAYGVIKRTNEIVEELVRQIDAAVKSRSEARAQIEHRNYEIAIEVSQLEATISGLRDEVGKKALAIESLEKSLADKEGKVEGVEWEMLEKIGLLEKKTLELKQLVEEYDDKLGNLEAKMESPRPLLVDQLNLVAKIHDRLYDVIKIVDANHLDSELSESLFLPQQTDLEENIRASLAGMESIYELSRIVVEKTRELVDQKRTEIESLNETADRLIKEKEHIGSLLRSTLSKRSSLDPLSKTSDLFQVAENGLKGAGIDFKFSKVPASPDKGVSFDEEEDEIYTLAGALENIVKASQLEIIELRHSVEELRAESGLLKERIEAQGKELNNRMHRIEELEEKERVANETVEGLMTDIAAAEEEIMRWKVAAEQEADAGRAIEQEFLAQLSALKLEQEEARQSLLESEKKLKFKEETAAAAMAAREAAEKSLRLADSRASRLRERVEELSHQLEVYDTQEDSRGQNAYRARYVCWPWRWLGLDFVGVRAPETQQQNSNEMELSEPFL